jgi:hypothetical protein
MQPDQLFRGLAEPAVTPNRDCGHDFSSTSRGVSSSGVRSIEFGRPNKKDDRGAACHDDVYSFPVEHQALPRPSRVNSVVGGRLEFRDRMGRSLESRGRGPLEDVAPFDPVELESHLGLETSDLSTYQ